MSCIKLTLLCIVLQSNVALLFGAPPLSDYKSHTVNADNKEIKVTSHINVGLPDNQDSYLNGRNLLRSHEIQTGDDSSMHIKIDISIPPEMLANSAKPLETSPSVNPEKINDLREETPQNPLPGMKFLEPSNPLDEPKSEGNLGRELNGGSKVELQSIPEKSGQTETQESEEGNQDLIEEEEEEEEEYEETEEDEETHPVVEESQPEQVKVNLKAGAADKTSENVEKSKGVKNEIVEEKNEDDGAKDQEQGDAEAEEGEYEDDEDFEGFGDEDVEDE